MLRLKGRIDCNSCGFADSRHPYDLGEFICLLLYFYLGLLSIHLHCSNSVDTIGYLCIKRIHNPANTINEYHKETRIISSMETTLAFSYYNHHGRIPLQEETKWNAICDQRWLSLSVDPNHKQRELMNFYHNRMICAVEAL